MCVCVCAWFSSPQIFADIRCLLMSAFQGGFATFCIAGHLCHEHLETFCTPCASDTISMRRSRISIGIKVGKVEKTCMLMNNLTTFIYFPRVVGNHLFALSKRFKERRVSQWSSAMIGMSIEHKPWKSHTPSKKNIIYYIMMINGLCLTVFEPFEQLDALLIAIKVCCIHQLRQQLRRILQANSNEFWAFIKHIRSM